MKKNYRKIWGVVLSLCLIMGLTGCTTYNNFKAAFFPGDKVAQEHTVKIAIYEATSGQNSSQGEEEVLGIELAHELYGTALDKKVELIYGDNQSNMYVGETVIQELLSQKPSFVLGSCGETVSLMASDYIKAASTPAITISASNPLLTANNEYYFSATFAETRQGDALADFAYTARNKDVVATVKMVNDDLATATIKRFTNRMKKLSENSGSVVGNYTLPADSTDYTQIIEQIRSSGAKAVFLAVSPSVAQTFMEQVVELRMTHVLFLGTRSWNDEKLLEFAKQQEKLEIAYPSDFSQRVTTPMSAIFVQAYKEKYGEDAEPSEAAAVAFDAYLLAIEAIERAQEKVMDTTEEDLKNQYEEGAALKAAILELKTAKETGIPSGRQIKEAMYEIKDFEGASGVFSYKGKNEPSKSITINHLVGGQEKPTFTSN